MAANAVISVFESEHHRQVEDLWAELNEKLGIRGVFVTPIPHFTYQVAEEYDVERLGEALKRLAANQRVFRVQTSGLGIFTGERPVVHIPIVRSAELTQFHTTVWNEISKAAKNISDYYVPARWIPHITLAQGNLTSSNLPQLARLLSNRSFSWDIGVDNLSFIHDTGVDQKLKFRFPLLEAESASSVSP